MNTTPAYPSIIDEQLGEIITRYQVGNRGKMWHIIDRADGKTVGFCVSQKVAARRAEQMEARHG